MGTAIALLILSISLIWINLRALNKEKNSFQSILSYSEKDLGEFQIEIGKLRREFSETLLEVQKEILELREEIEARDKDNIVQRNTKNMSTYKEIKDYNDKVKDIVNINFKNIKNAKNGEEKLQKVIDTKEEIEETLNNNIKVKEIQKLLDEGLSIEEISDALKIGKGEVLLIKELYLK